ncbi:hypothetical protein FHS20_004151 [Phyllobacterium endophyticum]|uniref:Uncharacterized protein n=1 Tax=Phyllobacterium endophyticum TaxID=1149773 RepID=A0A2P7AQX2_9HYPH|nr:hypothetical protein [Phyllobacterium endophyticum]PSH56629.1 hypothetical protein CU100_14760 [Phyllobacterium endophyticum]
MARMRVVFVGRAYLRDRTNTARSIVHHSLWYPEQLAASSCWTNLIASMVAASKAVLLTVF